MLTILVSWKIVDQPVKFMKCAFLMTPPWLNYCGLNSSSFVLSRKVLILYKLNMSDEQFKGL